MLEIVAKRDSLIALLEEERKRWRKSSCPTLITHYRTNLSNANTLSLFNSPIIFIFLLIICFLFSNHFVTILLSYFID